MSSRTERKIVLESGSPLWRHSLNQQKLKISRDGEQRILKLREERPNEEGSCDCHNNPDFLDFLNISETLDEKSIPIPERLGRISISITSHINRDLKAKPDDFIQKFKDGDFEDLPWGSPHKFLIPQAQMTLNVQKKFRGILQNFQNQRAISLFADTVAACLGQIKFDEDTHTTAAISVVSQENISKIVADAITYTNIDHQFARNLIVTFGETVNHELSRPGRYLPKKNKKR